MAQRGRALSRSAWRDGRPRSTSTSRWAAIALVAAAEALFDFDLSDEAPGAAAGAPRDPARDPAPRQRRGRPAGACAWRARSSTARSPVRCASAGTRCPRRSTRSNPHDARREIAALLIAAIDTTPGDADLGVARACAEPARPKRRCTQSSTRTTAPIRPRLPVLDSVLREVLRLHPPVHFIDRRPLDDVELDGRRLRAGAFLLVSPLVTHRDSRFYPDPEAFRPGPLGRRRDTALGLLPVRRRAAHVHRDAPGAARDGAYHRGGRAPLAARSGRGTPNARGRAMSLDLVDAVLYADIFDCAAAEDDVWRYSRVRAGARRCCASAWPSSTA